MARNLNENRNSSLTANGSTDTEVTGEPRAKTGGELVGAILADAYNIAIAVAMLAGAYWVIVGNVPLSMFGFVLLFSALLAVDILATVR